MNTCATCKYLDKNKFQILEDRDDKTGKITDVKVYNCNEPKLGDLYVPINSEICVYFEGYATCDSCSFKVGVYSVRIYGTSKPVYRCSSRNRLIFLENIETELTCYAFVNISVESQGLDPGDMLDLTK
jgi:hypothetical protein